MDLLELLHKHWGYTSFRPKQEMIVRSIMEGRDVAAVMPTGGGKSLCYQLPALAMQRTCVVISPLIALMQDQAAHMDVARIPAAFLNSSLDWREQVEVKRAAEAGALRLLYLSPERAVRPDMIEWLRKLPIGFFAIDEAHCISEWGHEFRPEYRQLRMFREVFPDKPIAAFTASATRAVRHDIVAQLKLREPATFVASFRRPNLRYAVRQREVENEESLLLAAARAYPEQNIIVYAPTIRDVVSHAAFLNNAGVRTAMYHGKMENTDRKCSQEQWMSGERRVMVGTLAFGLGINKPDVRAVLHLAMPKSLEQYYQEAGRAGRDGLPADCILLWRKRDTALLAHFINEIQDAEEQRRGWQRYRAMKQYMETQICRQSHISHYFGETALRDGCACCDVCGWSPEWLRQKFAGARKAPAKKTRSTGDVDSDVRSRLRQWRAQIASGRQVPAYCILHDSTLDEICRRQPVSLDDLLTVPGMGPKRVESYGEDILATLRKDG